MTDAAGTMREMLRGLPVFPRRACRSSTSGRSPGDPVTLFLSWLGEAVRDGVLGPHAMTLATADATGRVSSRVLICRTSTRGPLVLRLRLRQRERARPGRQPARRRVVLLAPAGTPGPRQRRGRLSRRPRQRGATSRSPAARLPGRGAGRPAVGAARGPGRARRRRSAGPRPKPTRTRPWSPPAGRCTR